jgi:hypothetical protein
VTCIDWADKGLPGALQDALATTVDTCDYMLDSMARNSVNGSSCVSICCINSENIWLYNMVRLPSSHTFHSNVSSSLTFVLNVQ